MFLLFLICSCDPGLNPNSYHLVNILLHGLVTLCLTNLMQSFIRTRWIRSLSGLAFAAHPIHCEAVASVVGRAELGSALHTLVALLAYRAHLKSRRRKRQIDPNYKEEEEEAEEEKEKYTNQEESSSSIDRQNDNNPFKRRPTLLSLFIRRVTICCYCPDQLKKSQYPAGAAAMSSLSHHGPISNRRRRHHHRHQDGESRRSGWHNGSAYLLVALVAASSAVLWKETGMAAIPLCAIMELVERHKTKTKPGHRASTDPHHQQVRRIEPFIRHDATLLWNSICNYCDFEKAS